MIKLATADYYYSNRSVPEIWDYRDKCGMEKCKQRNWETRMQFSALVYLIIKLLPAS